MAYDLIVKNGMIVDGSGFSRYRADVGVKDGRIVEIGKIRAAAEQTVDAEGRFVAPGVIDLHTHYDAQPFWDRLCTSSVWHGVTTVHAGTKGEPVPSRLAADAERVALGHTMAEFNRGIIEILPPSITQPDEADRKHLAEVARVSGRPVFFLVFDATSRTWVEGATKEGAQLFALLRAIPNNPRFTLKKATFFNSLDVWDVLMSKPFDERLAVLADTDKRAELRTAAVQRQRRRPGVLGRFV